MQLPNAAAHHGGDAHEFTAGMAVAESVCASVLCNVHGEANSEHSINQELQLGAAIGLGFSCALQGRAARASI
jgi:hypothetical protein